jgi:alkylation response protein AidB-like acyl-CoA dehydrogenase
MTTSTGSAGQAAAAAEEQAAADRVPDLLYSETETELRDSVRALLAARAKPEDVLPRADGSNDTGPGADTALWHALAADLGCASLLVPEDDDGAGASFREAATVAEELGRSVAPVPYLGSAIVATLVLLSAGDHRHLPELARGDATAALAVGFETAPGAKYPLTARVSGPGASDGRGGTVRLRGQVRGVADALDADLLIVPADGVPQGLYVVGARTGGVRRTPVTSLDMTRPLCDLEFDDAEARPIASGPAAGDAFGLGLIAGAAGLAAEQLGVAEKCLEMTVAYVKERRQFARPVGSFQGLKHRLADLWVAITQARAAARYAAACLAGGDNDTPVAVALAKAQCGDVAVHAAEECVQMHGGIGFTWEHPAHLYLKRAKADSIGFGTSSQHRATLATLVNLPKP